jgi:serine/threonine protein kinase
MNSITGIILLAFIAEACARELASLGVHDKLVDRTIKVPCGLCRADLDHTAFGKVACHGCYERDSIVRIWAGGLASLELGLNGTGRPIFELPASGSRARTLAELYRIKKGAVGEGTNGVVRPACHRSTKTDCVVKLVNKTFAPSSYVRSRPKAFEWQLRKSRTRKCDNVVRHLDFLEDHTNFIIVMERLYGEDLFEFLIKEARVTEAFCQGVMRQVLGALRYLHDEWRVIHRDVKVENFRYRKRDDITSGLVLLDFGQKMFDDQAWDESIVGTVPYLSPEVSTAVSQPDLFNDTQGQGPYSTAVDVWAAGVIMYILFTGDDPFTESEVWDLGKAGCHSEQLLAKALQHDRLRKVSDEAFDLLNRLLTVNPEARISAAQALSHPWLSSPAAALASESLGVPKRAYVATASLRGHGRASSQPLHQLLRRPPHGYVARCESGGNHQEADNN